MQPDTRTILRTGSITLLVGIFSALLMDYAFGGVTHQGPHTNLGWLSLMLAMGCLPTGVMMLALGFAKYLGDRRR